MVIKKILFSLVLVLGSLVCQAQEKEIALPASVVDKIIVDLHDLRDLKVKAAKQDSLIIEYEKELDERASVIVEAKITIDQYKELVNRLELKAEEREKAMKRLERRVKWLKTGHVLRTVAEVAIVVTLLLI
jgi:hypothetical protein